MVNTSVMFLKIKIFLIMFLWMGIAVCTIIVIDSLVDLPDEISGVLYFISIGIASSGTLNYYR